MASNPYTEMMMMPKIYYNNLLASGTKRGQETIHAVNIRQFNNVDVSGDADFNANEKSTVAKEKKRASAPSGNGSPHNDTPNNSADLPHNGMRYNPNNLNMNSNGVSHTSSLAANGSGEPALTPSAPPFTPSVATSNGNASAPLTPSVRVSADGGVEDMVTNGNTPGHQSYSSSFARMVARENGTAPHHTSADQPFPNPPTQNFTSQTPEFSDRGVQSDPIYRRTRGDQMPSAMSNRSAQTIDIRGVTRSAQTDSIRQRNVGTEIDQGVERSAQTDDAHEPEMMDGVDDTQIVTPPRDGSQVAPPRVDKDTLASRRGLTKGSSKWIRNQAFQRRKIKGLFTKNARRYRSVGRPTPVKIVSIDEVEKQIKRDATGTIINNDGVVRLSSRGRQKRSMTRKAKADQLVPEVFVPATDSSDQIKNKAKVHKNDPRKRIAVIRKMAEARNNIRKAKSRQDKVRKNVYRAAYLGKSKRLKKVMKRQAAAAVDPVPPVLPPDDDMVGERKPKHKRSSAIKKLAAARHTIRVKKARHNKMSNLAYRHAHAKKARYW